MINLLVDPTFSVNDRRGCVLTLSLPALFSAVCADSIASLPALRPHQVGAVHAFLAQLGFLACEKSGLTELPETEAQWRDALRALTQDWPNDEPWHLVVDDVEMPAFMQPPPGATALKNKIEFADQLDLLVTSKNHDLKQRLSADGSAEDWVYALISLQTQEGFLGAGNFGISRMNGGFASRSYLTLADAEFGFGGRIARDIRVLLSVRNKIHARGKIAGPALLWTLPWNGEQALALAALHPLYIEICRRIRMMQSDRDGLYALAGSSKVTRIDAKVMAGNVGDPWLALDVEKDIKAMTLAADGFSYKRVHRLLFDRKKYDLPLLAKPHAVDGCHDLVLQCFGLVRGQGKTEGVHSRRVLIPSSARGWFDAPTQLEILADRSKRMIDLCALAQGKALRPALIQLMQGVEDVSWTKPSNDKLCKVWLDQFETLIDAEFFQLLFELLPLAAEQAEVRLSVQLRQWAKRIFDQALSAAPGSEKRDDFAAGRARGLLNSALRKHLPAEPGRTEITEVIHELNLELDQ